MSMLKGLSPPVLSSDGGVAIVVGVDFSLLRWAVGAYS